MQFPDLTLDVLQENTIFLDLGCFGEPLGPQRTNRFTKNSVNENRLCFVLEKEDLGNILSFGER